MAEGKVRVVRCPNCQKLLPELADISIYRCGGCGTTLQAKRPAPDPESSPEKRDEGKAKYSEVSEGSSEMKDQVLDGNLETDPGGSQEDNRKEEESNLSASGSTDNITSKKDASLRVDAPVENHETECSGKDCQQESVSPVGKNISESGKGLVETNSRERGGTEKSNDESLHAQQAVAEHRVTGEDSRVFIEGAQQPYPHEVPSNCCRNSKRVYADCDDMRQNLEQDRADLLRVLDELRDQVQRKDQVPDKHKLSSMADRMTASWNSYTHNVRASRFPDRSSSLNHNLSLPNPREQKHNVNKLGFYHNMPDQAGTSCYGDPLAHRRVQFNQSDEYAPRHLDNYLHGRPDIDPANSYSQEAFYHQPACSCVYCHRRWLSVAARCPSTNLGKLPYFSNNHELHNFSTPSILSSRSYNSGFRHTPCSQEPRKYQSQRATLSKNNGRFCLPFAGATPFMICYNCCELLQVPDRSLLTNKKSFKLRCGACSKVISVQCDGRRIVTSATAPAKPVSPEKNDVAVDSPGDSVQSSEEKLVLPCIVTNSDHEMIERVNQNEFEKVKGSSLSEHVDNPDSISPQEVVPTSSDIPLGPQIKRVPSVPIPERLDCLGSDQAIDGSRSWSKRSEQEKFLNGSFKQNSLIDASMATEMDLLVNDFPNEEYSDMKNKPGVESKIHKVGDSFLAGLKKSFRFNKSTTYGRSKVSVNGHPISERLVRKAEKQAGKIHPGDYWYDYRAGFWGVMGHPCHGIIPPRIEEFNYPMPKNCAGGNTGVLVNGRELHKKDLDMLAGRGLPTLPGSYILDISGRLCEESSGEELDSLGKLAPTVEKMKHGFGMRVPRVFAK